MRRSLARITCLQLLWDPVCLLCTACGVYEDQQRCRERTKYLVAQATLVPESCGVDVDATERHSHPAYSNFKPRIYGRCVRGWFRNVPNGLVSLELGEEAPINDTLEPGQSNEGGMSHSTQEPEAFETTSVPQFFFGYCYFSKADASCRILTLTLLRMYGCEATGGQPPCAKLAELGIAVQAYPAVCVKFMFDLVLLP